MLKKKIIFVDKIQNILNNITVLVEVLGLQKILIENNYHNIMAPHTYYTRRYCKHL